jgi:uncharacterized protein (TIGR02594 family)
MTPYEMAERFKGIKEIVGEEDNAQIVAMLQRAQAWVKSDEVAWCSAFVGYVCWLLGLPETKNLRARSWLNVGQEVNILDAERGPDIVIFNRAGSTMNPKVIDAPGHVGFYHGQSNGKIWTLGGNQSNSVNIVGISQKRLLGVRRLV